MNETIPIEYRFLSIQAQDFIEDDTSGYEKGVKDNS